MLSKIIGTARAVSFTLFLLAVGLHHRYITCRSQ
jgi:hypothetical protein